MKVAIVGSRGYESLGKVVEFVESLVEDVTVVSGGAAGVDKTAASAARRVGLEVEEILPDWDIFGRVAGLIRNTRIVSAADIVVAFWDGKSKGTLDTIHKAKVEGKLLLVFD